MKKQPEFLPNSGKLRFRIGATPYVLYDTGNLEAATLKQLGERLGLSTGTILDAILSVKPALAKHNAWAINVIYESDAFKAGRNPSDQELATTTDERREALRDERHEIEAFMFATKERWHYEQMQAWPNPNGVLALPLQLNFANLLDQSKRYRTSAPSATALHGMLDKLDHELDRLSGALQDIDVVAHRNYAEVSGLMAIASVADVLIDYANADQITNLQKFKVFVEESVLPVASRRLLIDPRDFTSACAVRDDAAKKALKLLKQPTFIAEVRVVVNNRDVVDPYAYTRLYAQLDRATMLILRTKYADAFVDQEVMPAMRMFEMMRGKKVARFLEAMPEGEARAFFDDGWTAELPIGDSALGAALVTNNILINAVTNVEGPMALGVAVFAITAPRILERFAAEPLGYSGHRIFSATVVRMLLAYGKGDVLKKLQFGKVLSMASELPDAQRIPYVLKTYDATFELLNDNKYKTVTGRAFTSILMMVALFGALGTEEKPETLGQAGLGALKVLGAAGNAALGGADLVEIAPVAKILGQRMTEGLLKLSKKRIATFVAGAGIVVGVADMLRDSKRGDEFGMWIGGGNIAGGGLGLATWLFGNWAATASVPTYLLTTNHIGAAIAAAILIAVGVAQIIDIIRSLSGPEAFVLGIVEHLSRDDDHRDGPSAMRRAQMSESLSVLNTLANDAHFFRLPEAARKSLIARGFDGATLNALMAD